MKILVLGAGAVGGYFGGRLTEAGASVEFLVRDQRAAELRQRGLEIISPLGNFCGSVTTVSSATLAPGYDLIILACKAHGLSAATDGIGPAVAGHTIILPLLNGLSHLDTLDAAFGIERVAGGTCHLSASLGAAGQIIHLNRLQQITFGHRHGAQSAALGKLRDIFGRTTVEARYSEQALQAMWEKFVFITTLAALTCLMRASMGTLLRTTHGRMLTLEMLETCRATAERAGFSPDPSHLDAMTASMLADDSPLKASMLRDIEQGHATEAEHILGHMCRLAIHHGIDCPLLQAALSHLQAYEAQRQ